MMLDIFLLLILSFSIVFCVLIGYFLKEKSTVNFYFSLLWLNFIIYFFIYSESIFLYFPLLMLNSLISVYSVLIDTYSVDKFVFNCLFFKVISEFLIFLLASSFYLVMDGYYFSNSFMFLSSNFFCYLFIIISCIFSLVGCFGFWIYWVMGTSCYVSMYFHSCGFVIVGCVMISKLLESGFLYGFESVFLLMTMLSVCTVSFLIFTICYMMCKDLKKAMGFLSANGLSYLFLLCVVYPDIFFLYAIISALIKIFLFDVISFFNRKISQHHLYNIIFLFSFLFFFVTSPYFNFEVVYYGSDFLFLKDLVGFMYFIKMSAQVFHLFSIFYNFFNNEVSYKLLMIYYNYIFFIKSSVIILDKSYTFIFNLMGFTLFCFYYIILYFFFSYSSYFFMNIFFLFLLYFYGLFFMMDFVFKFLMESFSKWLFSLFLNLDYVFVKMYYLMPSFNCFSFKLDFYDLLFYFFKFSKGFYCFNFSFYDLIFMFLIFLVIFLLFLV